jgi:hypothetical protein
MRATKKHLESLIAAMAEKTEKPYVLDCSYGGYKLCLKVNPAGGLREITPRRHTAQEMATIISAILEILI